MTSERIQRRIGGLLDQADAAADQRDWEAVRSAAEAVLAFAPENADAHKELEVVPAGLEFRGHLVLQRHLNRQ